MKRNKPSLLTLVVTLTFVSLGSQAVHAQTSRTWVSTSGNDANACSKASPCRTFAGALGKTTAGGEIDVLDSGDFSPVTINKAVSIVAEGAIGGIQASTGNAITISAGGSDKIVLRGLSLDGQGTAADGISFATGDSLYVEDCTINHFGQYGVDFAPTNGTGKLFMTHTIVRNNGSGATGGGVHLISFSGPGFVATIDGLVTESNVFGVRGDNLGVVTIRNSVASGNSFSGFSAASTVVAAGLNVRMTIENSATTYNGTNGIVSALGGNVVVSNVTVTGNQTGLAGTSGVGEIISFGNNMVQGNVTDGMPTQTMAQR
jgi:hypothetical protein